MLVPLDIKRLEEELSLCMDRICNVAMENGCAINVSIGLATEHKGELTGRPFGKATLCAAHDGKEDPYSDTLNGMATLHCMEALLAHSEDARMREVADDLRVLVKRQLARVGARQKDHNDKEKENACG